MYLFLLSYSCVSDGYPCVLVFHCLTVLRALTTRPMGDKYAWLCPYILSDCRMDPVTSFRWENPIALGNTFLWALPGNSEFWVYHTHYCGEFMGFDHCSIGFSVKPEAGIGIACLHTICVRRSCGFYYVFTYTFIFIFNWTVH